jgi:hypothetical protein
MANNIQPQDIDLVALAGALARMGVAANHPVAGLPQLLSGTAAPTMSAPAGSLYLRQNGSSSVPYVNTSASSPGATWTAVTVP